jgi:hypothetical protein
LGAVKKGVTKTAPKPYSIRLQASFTYFDWERE